MTLRALKSLSWKTTVNFIRKRPIETLISLFQFYKGIQDSNVNFETTVSHYRNETWLFPSLYCTQMKHVSHLYSKEKI